VLWLHLKTVLRQLLLPPAGLLLLLFTGAVLWSRRPRLARSLILFATASMWLLACPVVSDWLVRIAQRAPPFMLSQVDGAQAIAVLGGGSSREVAPEYGGDPAADQELLDKLSYAAYLARRTSLPILVTGARVEALAMRATLRRNFDIEPRWIDADAYDTFDNARNAAQLLHRDGIHRVILITGAMHTFRASQDFLAAGLSVLPAPVGTLRARHLTFLDFVPTTMALHRSYEAFYELLGEPARQLLAATHLRRH